MTTPLNPLTPADIANVWWMTEKLSTSEADHVTRFAHVVEQMVHDRELAAREALKPLPLHRRVLVAYRAQRANNPHLRRWPALQTAWRIARS